jgi:hypothetical protein
MKRSIAARCDSAFVNAVLWIETVWIVAVMAGDPRGAGLTRH